MYYLSYIWIEKKNVIIVIKEETNRPRQTICTKRVILHNGVLKIKVLQLLQFTIIDSFYSALQKKNPRDFGDFPYKMGFLVKGFEL